MNRRELLKLLSLGIAGHALDLDRLLWVPGQKKIFIPTNSSISMTEIVAAEYERVMPHIFELFNRDDTFYRTLNKRSIPTVSSRDLKIPLVIKL